MPKSRRLSCACRGSTYRPSSLSLPCSSDKEIHYYEAQQQTRVVAARYVKSASWDAAIDILFNVSQSLLKAGQGGSGGDLSLFLVDVYRQAELKVDSGSKGKLLALLRLFDSDEPTRKKFIGEMIGI